MIYSDETATRALNNLIVIQRDAEQGYKTGAVDARDAELTRLFCEYAAQRGTMVEELQDRVKTMKGEPQLDGSLLGKIHRQWMDLEAAEAEAVNHAILSEIERGEDLAVLAYKEALQIRDLDEITRKLVQAHYEQVQLAHDRIRQLRDSAEYAHR